MPQKLLKNLPHFQPYFKDLALGDLIFSWLQIVANSFPFYAHLLHLLQRFLNLFK